MKKLKLILLLFAVHYASTAQDKLLLNKYSGKEIFITVNNNKANVTIGSESKQYELTNDKGLYTLKDHSLKSAIYSFMNIDTNEVIAQLSNAFPNMSAIDMLINKAGANNTQEGIIIKPSEQDILPTETINDEEGGRSVVEGNSEQNDSGMPSWIWYVLPAIATLIVGYAIGRGSQKKTSGPASNTLIDNTTVATDEIEEPEIIINDEKDIAKAKAKIKELQSQKSKLNSLNKKQKEELSILNAEIEKNNKFQSAYYQQAMKDLIIPFANAATTGDKKAMVNLAFKIVAQYSSKARHEVQNKQQYDTINIANLLQQQIDQGNIPVITADFPQDQIPNYIRNIISVMEDYQAASLGSNIIMGYKIAKG